MLSFTHIQKVAKPAWANQLTRQPCLEAFVKVPFSKLYKLIELLAPYPRLRKRNAKRRGQIISNVQRVELKG